MFKTRIGRLNLAFLVFVLGLATAGLSGCRTLVCVKEGDQQTGYARRGHFLVGEDDPRLFGEPFVDCDACPPEGQFATNEYRTQIGCRPIPDLVLKEVRNNTQIPVGHGSTIDISFTVANEGLASAPFAKVKVTLEGGAGPPPQPDFHVGRSEGDTCGDIPTHALHGTSPRRHHVSFLLLGVVC
jgi:hypothetical protein